MVLVYRLEGAIASKQIELQKLDQANEQSRSQEQDLNLAKHELELLTTRISQVCRRIPRVVPSFIHSFIVYLGGDSECLLEDSQGS